MPEEKVLKLDSATQKKLVALILFKPQRLGAGMSELRPEYFDHPALTALVIIVFEHNIKYQCHPTLEEVEAEFNELFKNDPRLPEEEYRAVFEAVLAAAEQEQYEWVADKALEFARRQGANRIIEQLSERIKRGRDIDLKVAADEMAAVAAIGEFKDKGGIVTLASDQRTRKPLSFLWHEKFQKGKLTLIVGDPESGKSLFATWMAAQISAGRTWPDNTPCEKGRVLFIQGEEDWEEVVKARLEQYGADESLVYEVVGVKDSSGENRIFSLQSDIAALGKAILDFGDVKAIFIDPIQGYFGGRGINSNADAHVRSVLMPLAALASDTNVAIVGISHLNKVSSKDEVKAMYRTGGSIGIMAVARTVWLMAWDRDPNGLRYLQRIKNSRKAGLSGMALHIVPEDKDDLRGGDILWREEVKVPSAQALLSVGEERSRTAATQSWCRNYLSTGPKDSAQLYTDAEEQLGIGEQAVRRALHAIGASTVLSYAGHPAAWRL